MQYLPHVTELTTIWLHGRTTAVVGDSGNVSKPAWHCNSSVHLSTHLHLNTTPLSLLSSTPRHNTVITVAIYTSTQHRYHCYHLHLDTTSLSLLPSTPQHNIVITVAIYTSTQHRYHCCHFSTHRHLNTTSLSLLPFLYP